MPWGRTTPSLEAAQAAVFQKLVAYPRRYRLEPPNRFVTSVDVARSQPRVSTDQVLIYPLNEDRLDIVTALARMPRQGDGGLILIGPRRGHEKHRNARFQLKSYQTSVTIDKITCMQSKLLNAAEERPAESAYSTSACQLRSLDMKMYKLHTIIAIAGLLAGTYSASASTVFFDGTFNPADYASTAKYTENSGSTIMFMQCSSCGDPATALQFNSSFGGTGSTNTAVDLGAYNLTFAYDPTTQGAISSITASVDKNEILSETGTGIGNTFRPLIEQGGMFYLAAIPGPTVTGPTGPGGSGYKMLSANLTASDFTSFDFATDTFGTSHPNFEGSTFYLGIGQVSSLQPGSTASADYDNLKFTLSAVPLPASAPLFGAALLALGAVGYSMKRKTSATA